MNTIRVSQTIRTCLKDNNLMAFTTPSEIKRNVLNPAPRSGLTLCDHSLVAPSWNTSSPVVLPVGL